MTNCDPHRHSNDHHYGFLATRPNLCALFWSRQYISVELDVFFFPRHVEQNSRFNVMKINKIHCDRPKKIVAGFSVIFCFVYWLRSLRTSLMISTKIFTPRRLVPRYSGLSDSMISTRQFYCTIYDWEYENFNTFRRNYFICIESSSMDCWRVQSSQLPKCLQP